MTDLGKAKEFFAADLYATEVTGIEIVEAREKYARCSLVLEERHKNAVGHVMGGVLFTLADFVFGISANFGAAAPTVTVSSNIHFLASPRGRVIYGESKLLKDGKRSCFYEITVSDEDGSPVAIVTVNGMHL